MIITQDTRKDEVSTWLLGLTAATDKLPDFERQTVGIHRGIILYPKVQASYFGTWSKPRVEVQIRSEGGTGMSKRYISRLCVKVDGDTEVREGWKTRTFSVRGNGSLNEPSLITAIVEAVAHVARADSKRVDAQERSAVDRERSDAQRADLRAALADPDSFRDDDDPLQDTQLHKVTIPGGRMVRLEIPADGIGVDFSIVRLTAGEAAFFIRHLTSVAQQDEERLARRPSTHRTS